MRPEQHTTSGRVLLSDALSYIRRISVASVPFASAAPSEAARLLVTLGKQRTALPVRFMNAWSVVCAHQDEMYMSEVSGHGVNFPDGRPISVIAKLKRRGGLAQVRGPSAFRAVLDEGRAVELRHFLLGGSDETLELLSARLRELFPGIIVSGSHAPPFAPLDSDFVNECAEAIMASDADIVWVSLGTPKQDHLAFQLAREVGRPCVGIGAAFDFVAGTVPEAPNWMTRLGMEWLHRLASEPRRLWRRYIIGNALFIWYALTK